MIAVAKVSFPLFSMRDKAFQFTETLTKRLEYKLNFLHHTQFKS